MAEWTPYRGVPRQSPHDPLVEAEIASRKEKRDDVRRSVPNRKADTGGTGQGGMVLGDDAGQEDIRGITQSAKELEQARRVIIGPRSSAGIETPSEVAASDAPVWYGADQANAWANGYNTAIAVFGALQLPRSDDAAQRGPCPGCDGHECDDGCNYPGAQSSPPSNTEA